MDTSSQRVAAAFPPMQERDGSRSRTGGRPALVPLGVGVVGLLAGRQTSARSPFRSFGADRSRERVVIANATCAHISSRLARTMCGAATVREHRNMAPLNPRGTLGPQ